jgi:hypothetical protein
MLDSSWRSQGCFLIVNLINIAALWPSFCFNFSLFSLFFFFLFALSFSLLSQIELFTRKLI